MHGTVALPPLLVAVMDTPHFQRLDQIQQLGGCHFVYPSAKHSRKAPAARECSPSPPPRPRALLRRLPLPRRPLLPRPRPSPAVPSPPPARPPQEHSIGVAHLAGTLLKHLRVQQPEDWRALALTQVHHGSRLSDSREDGEALSSVHSTALAAGKLIHNLLCDGLKKKAAPHLPHPSLEFSVVFVFLFFLHLPQP